MKNVNWSKWIAVALTIVILTQFVQVAFLGAQKFGIGSSADAGADASKGSIAEEAYGAIFEKVTGEDDIVMTAEAAAQTLGSVTFDYTGEPDLKSKKVGTSFDMTFNVSAIEGSAATYTISLPDKLSLTTGATVIPSAKVGIDAISATKGDNSISVNVTALENSQTSSCTFTLSGVTLAYNNLNTSTEEVDDITVSKNGDTSAPTSLATLTFPKKAAISVALTEVNGSTISGTDIDLHTKNMTTDTTSFTFQVTAPVGAIASGVETVLELPSGFSIGTANTVHEDILLTDDSDPDYVASYSNTDATHIKITTNNYTNGTSGSKTGTFTVSGVTFNSTTIESLTPASAKHESFIVGSSTYNVLYPGYTASTVAATDGKIYITRLTSRKAGESGSATYLVGCTYKLFRNSDGTGLVGTKITSFENNDREVFFENLEIAEGGTTYYLEETTTANSNAKPSVAVRIGANDVSTQEPSIQIEPTNNRYPITLTATEDTVNKTGKQSIVQLQGYYLKHELELVKEGEPVGGKSITINGATFWKNIDGTANNTTNSVTWTTPASGTTSCYGTFVNGGSYTMSVPDADNNPVNVSFTLDAAGKITSTTSNNTSKITAVPSDDGMKLTITQVVPSTPATLNVDTYGSDTSATIKSSSSVYDLYKYDGTKYNKYTTDEHAAAATGRTTFSALEGSSSGTKYKVVQTYAANNYAVNSNEFYFTVDLEGNITPDPDHPIADSSLEWDNTNKILKVTDTKVAYLEITRNNVWITSTATLHRNTISGAKFKLYTKENNAYVALKDSEGADAEVTTGSDGSARFTKLPAFASTGNTTTYYLKETTSVSNQNDGYGLADHGTTGTAGDPLTLNSDGYFVIPVSAAGDDPKNTAILDDYLAYGFELRNQNNSRISGKTIVLEGDFYDETATSHITNKTINLNTESTKACRVEGQMISGKNYKLTVPAATGTGTEEYTITVESTPVTGPYIKKVGSFDDFSYNTDTRVVSVERNNGIATLLVQMIDNTTGDEITSSEVSYKLASYTTANPTGTEDAITVLSSTKGLLSYDIEKSTEAKKFYIMENRTSESTGAPAGYKANSTSDSDIKYLFAVDATGKITYASGSNGWVVSPKDGINTIKYTRLPANLTITRTDAEAQTNNAVYTLYTSKDCSDASKVTGKGDGKIITSGTGAGTTTWSGLTWGETYYLKETTTVATGSTYAKDEAVHGPYVFAPSETDAKVGSGKIEYKDAEILITDSFAAQKVQVVDFKVTSTSLINKEYTIKDLTNTSAATMTFKPTAVNTNVPVSGFITGHKYSVTLPDSTSTTTTTTASNLIEFTFEVDSLGNVGNFVKTKGTITSTDKTSTANPIITIGEEIAAVSFSMEICTAELTYGLTEADELTTVAGYVFGIYTDSNASTAVEGLTDSTGATIKKVSTDSSGKISFCGLADGTYYLKYEGTETGSDATKATKVQTDSGAIYKVTVSKGTGTVSEKVKGSYWKVKSGTIRAYLQTGKISLTSNTGDSNRRFYIYRLYDGDTSDKDQPDEREDEKICGDSPVNDMTTSENSKFTKYVAWLEKSVKDLFVLTAHAADAKLIKHGTADGEDLWWELLGSKDNPGSGKSLTFENLISGQSYLIREGTSETEDTSNDKYYLVKNVSTSGKSIAGVASSASTASSGASTARSGASGTNATGGSGTQNNGTGAGGRGAATGDDSRLWFHLIIMLVAFDALAADLLFITRKKKKVRN